MILTKSKTSIVAGVASVLTAILSVLFFFYTRGPNADVYFAIKIFSILSTLGIIFSVLSMVISKRQIGPILLGILGLLTNLVVLVFTFLLLLAMGISES
ncbi:hypothetical protein [Bacillus ndiopicus]|uniref:hypothetical protein n=1 Tax=Bacillus ndiopicus TaxID=1347368 RepID=UPI0005A71080|nr:hypothetical protein [Bacillus ndiopicus]